MARPYAFSFGGSIEVAAAAGLAPGVFGSKPFPFDDRGVGARISADPARLVAGELLRLQAAAALDGSTR